MIPVVSVIVFGIIGLSIVICLLIKNPECPKCKGHMKMKYDGYLDRYKFVCDDCGEEWL